MNCVLDVLPYVNESINTLIPVVIPRGMMDLLINPLKPNEISLYFQLGQSIPVLKVVKWYFFLFNFQ